jgi:protein ImuA
LGAIIAEVARLSMTVSRGLQLAAENGDAIGLAIRPWRRQTEAADFGRRRDAPTAPAARCRAEDALDGKPN